MRPPIKWLTQDQIKAAAAESPLAAAECSSVHWGQILEAGPDRYWYAQVRGKVSAGGEHCALCYRYCRKSGNCHSCRPGCQPEWHPAYMAVWSRRTGLTWPAPAQAAIQALIDKIDSKIKVLKGAA
ncbi:hypothetical protein KAR91_50880 [Candidatus Pacearchaeota archaeon]|nr:hypothetical protein [Candidatus Pacearchaeota archaeon]